MAKTTISIADFPVKMPREGAEGVDVGTSFICKERGLLGVE